MKILIIPLALLTGYISAITYFLFCMFLEGETWRGDFWSVIIFVAIYGFALGLVTFSPVFLLVKPRSRFWTKFISVPVGALSGILLLYSLIPELAVHYAYGGQAMIMAGVTFCIGSLYHKKYSKS